MSKRLSTRGYWLCVFKERVSHSSLKQTWFFWHHNVTWHGPCPFPPLRCACRQRMLRRVILLASGARALSPSSPVPTRGGWDLLQCAALWAQSHHAFTRALFPSGFQNVALVKSNYVIFIQISRLKMCVNALLLEIAFVMFLTLSSTCVCLCYLLHGKYLYSRALYITD